MIVITEKLQPLPRFSGEQGIKYFIDQGFPEICFDGVNKITNSTITTLVNTLLSDQSLMKQVTNPELSKALRIIKVLSKHYELDLNLDNLMVRSNNQLVFSDPISHAEGQYIIDDEYMFDDE